MLNIDRGVNERLARSESALRRSGSRSSGRARGRAVPPRASRSPLAMLLVVAVSFGIAACRQDMHDQPRYKPYAKSDFWGDDRSARPLPEGTVARGQLRADAALYTGKDGRDFVAAFPVAVDEALILRGQQRYNIYCSPCHGRTGAGNGVVVQRGFKQPPSFHIDRLRDSPPGYVFDVMTSGFGAMQDYSAQIEPKDRWAIVAYLRALQYSQHATVDDVPTDKRGALTSGPAAAAGHGAAPEGHR